MWRKPNIYMWQFMVAHCNGDKQIDTKVSFYCGDAAGKRYRISIAVVISLISFL